ncbi:hypothetical protein ACSHT2_03795 [Bradyrhizobium sp. PUT101]|uniref:hypothetical protein n=1 Tax=Bradyrhizobium sp. PUT101 TaxID=3447427 RepID=UPI003F86F106
MTKGDTREDIHHRNGRRSRGVLGTCADDKIAGRCEQRAGQQMQNTTKPSTGPGASEYAPGHQTNTTAGPGRSESAPGQKMQNTTGSSTTRK